LDAWATQYGVTLHVIQLGKQVQNVFIESFTGKFRDECLNEHWFLTLQEARVVVEAWRRESDASELTVRSGMWPRWSSFDIIMTDPRQHRSQLRWPWCNNWERSGQCDHDIYLLVRFLWTLLDPFLHGIQQDILSDGFSKMVRAAGS
jgi:hypothetical protein